MEVSPHASRLVNSYHGRLEWPKCAVSIVVMGRERERDCPEDLLSDDVCVMTRLDFEAAVVGPQVHGYADASDTALVDLKMCQWRSNSLVLMFDAHHLSRLCTSY